MIIICASSISKTSDMNDLSSGSELTIHVDGTKATLWSGCPRSRVGHASRRMRVAGAHDQE